MLLIQGEQLKYQLTPLESLGALAKSPTTKVSNLVSINRFDDPWNREVLRSIRAPGTGFPFSNNAGNYAILVWTRLCCRLQEAASMGFSVQGREI